MSRKSDGMYRRGGPNGRREARELVDDFKRAAIDRARDIRAWLTEAIAPHVVGPYDPPSFFESDAPAGWYEPLRLSTGAGIYRITAERGGWQESCVDALRENAELEKLLSDGGELDSIMRLSVRQGQYVERIQARAVFAPLVMSGRKATIERPKAMRDKKAAQKKRTNDAKRQSALQALEWAKQQHPTAAADGKITFLKTKAAEHLRINVGTLNRRLRKPK